MRISDWSSDVCSSDLDMTARDAQIAEMSGGLGPAKGKDFDTGNVLGPWITTADAVGDIRYLGVRALVNGQIIAETTAAGMQHDVVQVLDRKSTRLNSSH